MDARSILAGHARKHASRGALFAAGLTGCTAITDLDDLARGGAASSGTSTVVASGSGAVGAGAGAVTGGTGGTPMSGAGSGGGGSGGAPSDCSGPARFADADSGHCYSFAPGLTGTWSTARDECLGHGAGWDLAAITSSAELAYVWSTIFPATQVDAWIGGQDAVEETVWTWSSGEQWSFAPWDMGEPNNGAVDAGNGQDCLNLNWDSPTFADDYCDNAQTFLCERP